MFNYVFLDPMHMRLYYVRRLNKRTDSIRMKRGQQQLLKRTLEYVCHNTEIHSYTDNNVICNQIASLVP